MSHHRYAIVGLVALLWMAAGQGIAHAQDDVAAARAHYSKGTRLYEVGEYRQALSEFKAAHVAKPDAAFLYNIAQCHRQLDEIEQAVVMYKRYLAATPRAANRAEVEKRIADLESELAATKARPAAAPAAPVAGTTAVDPLPAQPAAVPPPPAGDAGALAATAPPAGTAGASPAPARSSLRVWRWVGVGVTAALAGAAIATGLAASSKYDDLKGSCGSTAAGCSGSQIDSVKSRALLTNLLWGAAGVAAVGTGVMFYLSPSAAAVQMAWRF